MIPEWPPGGESFISSVFINDLCLLIIIFIYLNRIIDAFQIPIQFIRQRHLYMHFE